MLCGCPYQNQAKLGICETALNLLERHEVEKIRIFVDFVIFPYSHAKICFVSLCEI